MSSRLKWSAGGEVMRMQFAFNMNDINYYRSVIQRLREFEAAALGDRGSGEQLKDESTRKREVLAHDWAFPESGHDPTKPLAIVLHGLNGGSAEPLVMDFVASATASGWTCVVLNARGLGGARAARRRRLLPRRGERLRPASPALPRRASRGDPTGCLALLYAYFRFVVRIKSFELPGSAVDGHNL